MMGIRRLLPLGLLVCLWHITLTVTAFSVPTIVRIQRHSLHSLSPLQQEEQPLHQQQLVSQTLKDVCTVLVHGVSCAALAVLVSLYQDYDCSHLQRVLRPHALYGMGYGREDRLLSREYTSSVILGDDNAVRYIPSYNEVLKQHYETRVPMWHNPTATPTQVENSVTSIIQSLEAVDTLKSMAREYQWTEMQTLIRQPVLTTDLEQACTVLRRAATTPEARDEIGFDWGRYDCNVS